MLAAICLVAFPSGPFLAHDPPGDAPSDYLSFSSSSDLFVVVSSDIASNDHLGRSLAIDGPFAVSGSRYAEHSGAVLTGAAYVFESQGLNWVERQKLIGPDPQDQDLFGHDVAISGDTLLVSARNDDVGGVIDAGSVYVFVREGAEWVLETQLIAPDAEDFDAFGVSVTVEGDRAVVGATFDDDFGQTDMGSVYVFLREGGQWALEAKLTPSDGDAGDDFGRDIALQGDHLVVGAPRHDGSAAGQTGAAYVFERVEGQWVETAKLITPDALSGDLIGKSVAIDGNTILLGVALDDQQGVIDRGSVAVYVLSEGVWSPEAKLLASDARAGDEFGHDIDLDGDRAAIGANQADLGAVENAGSVYLFERAGSSWSEGSKVTAAVPGPIENFGSKVVFAEAALVVGAPHQNPDGLFQAGALQVFPFEADCNGNGIDDVDELVLEASLDCNQNWILDSCDLAAGTALDLDGDGTLDSCQPFAIDGATLSIAAGGTLGLTLDAGSEGAGEYYVVLGSFSGVSPGLSINGQSLPLNLDAYFLLTLQGSGPIDPGLGFLDAEGQAAAALTVPGGLIAPTAAGQVVQHAFATVDPMTAVVTFASNAIPTELVP